MNGKKMKKHQVRYLICITLSLILIIFAVYRVNVAKKNYAVVYAAHTLDSAKNVFINSGINSILNISSIIDSPVSSYKQDEDLLTVTYENNVILEEYRYVIGFEYILVFNIRDTDNTLSDAQVERFIKERFPDDCQNVAENFLNAYQNSKSYNKYNEYDKYDKTFDYQGTKLNVGMRTFFEKNRTEKTQKSITIGFSMKI